ncbi:Sulfate transport system permease protein CysW (plasmid) [Marinibacterium anthonyi]|nr:Sulfate transport system permease protein CysW [Marinibacterium anthonyi]
MLALKRTASHILPGFSLSLGITVLFLCLIVLLPISGLLWQLGQLGPSDYLRVMGSERVLTALRATFTAAAAATLVNGVFGLLLAWVLTRYRFPGRGVMDALVDLPFALPTAVAGIALVALYDKSGWIGGLLDKAGIQVACTWWGIAIAMIFTSIPFAVRAIQPAIEEQDRDEEKAALTLGVNGFAIFRHIVLPNISWGLAYGTVLTMARAMGEFGAVSVVSGAIRGQTMTLPLQIELLYNDYNATGAFAAATVLAGLALVTLALRGLLGRFGPKRRAST